MSAAPPTVAGKRPFPRWRSKSITVDTEVEVYVSEILDRVETEDLIDELRERAAAGDAVPNDAIPRWTSSPPCARSAGSTTTARETRWPTSPTVSLSTDSASSSNRSNSDIAT